MIPSNKLYPTKDELKSLYNEVMSIKLTNNCYAFVMGAINTDMVRKCESTNLSSNECKKPQPGYVTGVEHWSFDNLNGREIMKRVLKDSKGKIYIPDTKFFKKFDKNMKKEVIYDFRSEPCKDGYYKGALVIAEGNNTDRHGDYHFYREMHDGTWLHKRGQSNVIDYDASRKEIKDPFYADRKYGERDYSIFCSYFCIPYGELFQVSANLESKTPEQIKREDSKKVLELENYIHDQLDKIHTDTFTKIQEYHKRNKTFYRNN